MKSIEAFYRSVNKSIIPADNQWYIDQTNMLMDSVLRTKSRVNHLLILGTGNMNDMSLDFFLQKFETVTLTDIDVKSIEEQENINRRNPKIIIKQMDYLGLKQSGFFDGLKEQLISATTNIKVKEILKDKVKSMLSYHFSSLFSQKYDVVYLSPIYTQLLYRQVETFILALVEEGYEKHLAEVALEILLQEMIYIIDHFNDEVGTLVRKNGLVFIASDIFLLSDDQFSRQIKDNINHDDLVEEVYRNYHETYGFGLGDYGLYSATKLLNILKSKWFIWHQSEHQTYAVKFCAFEKIDE